MAVLSFTGDLTGRKITNSSGDISLEAGSNKDVIVKVSGASGDFNITNTSGVIGSVNSAGSAVFASTATNIVYTASGGAGSYAAGKTALGSALDALFSGDFMVWNEASALTANGTRTNFTTVGNKTFISGKIMVFANGQKQRLGVDYSENANRYSVDFFVAPVNLQPIDFVYIKG